MGPGPHCYDTVVPRYFFRHCDLHSTYYAATRVPLFNGGRLYVDKSRIPAHRQKYSQQHTTHVFHYIPAAALWIRMDLFQALTNRSLVFKNTNLDPDIFLSDPGCYHYLLV